MQFSNSYSENEGMKMVTRQICMLKNMVLSFPISSSTLNLFNKLIQHNILNIITNTAYQINKFNNKEVTLNLLFLNFQLIIKRPIHLEIDIITFLEKILTK